MDVLAGEDSVKTKYPQFKKTKKDIMQDTMVQQ